MSTCSSCGHELGVGRFCTNCGRPVTGSEDEHVDWRTDTAERPRTDTAERPLSVLPVDPAPGAPQRPPDSSAASAPSDPTGTAGSPDASGPAARHRQRGAPLVLPWLAGLLVLATVAGLGSWLLFADGEESSGADEQPAAAEATTPPSQEPGEESEASQEPATQSPTPNPEVRGKPTDLAGSARVSAPAPAPPSQDTDGDTVRYVAGNMTDSDPTTAWRMRGDGTGESITLRFDQPVRLREIGLINGYAKTGSGSRGAIDWYSGNRRIRSVEWTFDDGTVLRQRLGDTRRMQTKKVRRVDTESVTIRLLQVTTPGSGRAARNYTAISGVHLRGSPLAS